MGKKLLKTNINKAKIVGFSKNYAVLLVLILIIVISAILEDVFFSYQNITNVLRQISMAGIMACGATVVLVSGSVDISIGAILTLSGCLMGVLLPIIGVWPSIIAAILCGTLLGTINGVLVTLIGGELGGSFIVTFGMKTVIYALALILTGGYFISIPESPVSSFFGKGMVGPVPFPVIVFIVVVLLGHFVLAKTPFGRRAYFIGGNKEASRLSGINVSTQRILAFVIEGFLAGLAAVIYVTRVGSAKATMGEPFDFDVLTMAIVGGVVLGGGKGSMMHAFIGVIVIGVLTNILTIMNVSNSPQMIIKGFLMVFSVWFDAFNNRNTVEGM